jgi:hypothetical protein
MKAETQSNALGAVWFFRSIAVWGPGPLVMLADSDAGNVVTAAQSGAQWGGRRFRWRAGADVNFPSTSGWAGFRLLASEPVKSAPRPALAVTQCSETGQPDPRARVQWSVPG